MESASPNAIWGPFMGKTRSILSWHPPGLEMSETHFGHTVDGQNPALPRIRNIPSFRVLMVMQDFVHQPYSCIPPANAGKPLRRSPEPRGGSMVVGSPNLPVHEGKHFASAPESRGTVGA